MAKFVPVDPFDIVIFGGTGDLSRRKLMPALWHRWLDGQIPPTSAIIGTARSEMDSAGYRQLAREACEKASGESWDAKAWAQFEKIVHYVTIDATKPDADWASLRKLLTLDAKRPRVFYLATSPHLYVDICRAIGLADLADEPARVVLEKPIGTDLESARAINDGVGEVFAERQVFRIDHYLGKETVQNLMVLRFANMLFEPLWSHNYIDHVQITVAENLGLEGRADYYDRSGALRDMVQNHLLQLLCLTAMEPPNDMGDDDIRTEKIKVLNALGAIAPEQVEETDRAWTIRLRPAGRQTCEGLSGGAFFRQWQQDGNLRRREGRGAQLALGGRAVLPAHRKAHVGTPFGYRDPVQARAAQHFRRRASRVRTAS